MKALNLFKESLHTREGQYIPRPRDLSGSWRVSFLIGKSVRDLLLMEPFND